MGRQQKYPERLYISPPQTPTSTPSSFLSFKSATASSAALLSETSTAVGEKIPGFKTSAGMITPSNSYTVTRPKQEESTATSILTKTKHF